jgi:protein-S-isoprenylcysteine O-methyltransferase Ste14
VSRRIFAIIAYLIGLAGASVFMLYVLAAGIGLVECAEPPGDGVFPWLNNLGWLFLFAVQHSGMARQAYKDFIVRWIDVSIERSVYVLMSGIVLTLLTLFWQPLPGEPLWHGPLWIVAISLLGVLGIVVCAKWFDHNTFFGLTQAWTGNADTTGPLVIAGPYRYVRHPLMLGLLIALWGQPMMPPELAMLNAGMTIYVLVAIRWEERDLVRVFGMEYEEYRMNVPALIPFVRLARNRKR